MLISPEQEALIDRVFETYLTDHHHNDILQLIEETEDNEDTHRPLVVNAMTLFEANMEIGDYFNAYPTDILAIFDKVLNRKAKAVTDDGSLKHNEGQRKQDQRLVHTLHARITGLPVCPELTRDTIPRTRDVGHFLSVTGTVIRTSIAKVLEYERDYMCTKCRHVFTVQAEFEQFYTFVPPVACPNPDSCNSYKFTCLSEGSEPAACRDYQEIKIQEQVQKLSVGSIPRSLLVVLENDLVDSCKSGDDVTVYGVMCLRWKTFYDGALCDVELVLKANNIEVNNQQAAAGQLVKDAQEEFEEFWNSYKHNPIAGRNHILLSLCPQVFGMYVIKLAVAMVLAGGVQRIDSSGTKIRGECHMLLVGDPGTGKSQFLKYAAKIMCRSVLTAGIGSTSAGLTVAAVKDGGDWHLEAGALVLADGGLCCIDEFNSIKEQDRISIHEAMEQQSISVAKAGMVCKLNTRTTILAATNPKGQYDPNEPLSVNVALASPLLSRFDLVLVLLDTRNAEWDHIISSFIMEDRGLPDQCSSLWSMEKMKAYFSLIKHLKPVMSEEANCILTRYYQLQRRSDGSSAARTTIRTLESLSRLAEAHAKLMYRETVTIEDAVIAVSVMECSMQGGVLQGNVNTLFTSFPADPVEQYQTQCQILLEGLNLPLFLKKERDRLSRSKSQTSESPECDSSTTKLKHLLSDANSKTHTSNLESGNTVRSDSNWFHTSLSLSPNDRTSPITTPQENTKTISSGTDVSKVTRQSSCRSEKLTSRRTVAPVVFGNITSVSEQNIQGKKNESVTEEISKSQEEILKYERKKHEAHPEPLGYHFQKVSRSTMDSKNMGDKGFGQLDLKHQRFHKEVGKGHRERLVFGDESENVLETNLSTDKDSYVKEDKLHLTKSRKSSAVPREKMAVEAETHIDLRGKLSRFMFKPSKMRTSVDNHNNNASPDKEMTVSVNTKKPISHNDAHLCQRTRVSTGDDRDIFTSTPLSKSSACITNQTTLQSEQMKTSITSSSSEIKLSGFSSIWTSEPTTAQTKMENSTLKKGDANCLRANSKVHKILNIANHIGKKCQTIPPATDYTPAKKCELGMKSTSTTMSECKVKQTEFSHTENNTVKMVTRDSVNCQRTASLKRKCFTSPQDSNSSGSKGLFSGLSLFESAELNNDVLDTDWDQEVLKKAKV
ncbi:DNA helicase MCM9 isoform X1 [Simochromis diagramma]|uniref:DNA helicase MCM9 isoform X1 n=2 Tax=Simochromis diagramma TaxID=43689 RepID=UPI001A7EF9B1|nr:DNA helicase MCM9 isoform X1 [Simochromis diagramma]